MLLHSVLRNGFETFGVIWEYPSELAPGDQAKMQRNIETSPPNRVCVITGASAGVGRATAIHFAKHGWNVAW